MTRLFGVVALLVCIAAPAAAQSPCTGFAWPLDVELGWLSAMAVEALKSGARLPAPPPRAFVLALGPSASVALPVPPSGKPHGEPAETYAGFVTVAEVGEPGLYQVTLSGAGWIDVVQHGSALPAAAHTSSPNCPILRKSVRFRLAQGSATFELSSVPNATIELAIRRAE